MNAKQLSIFIAITFLTLYSVSTLFFHDDFHDGWGPYKEQNYKTAFKVWLPLAEQKNFRAQFYLGVMFEKGQGIPQDYNEAVKWYRLAAEQGYSTANSKIYSLAKIKVPTALEMLENDAINGDAHLQFLFGSMYEKGQGVPLDFNEAFKWYQLAFKQGHAPAKSQIYKLAKMSVFPALKFLTEDAENGVPEAQLILGQEYEKGQGVSQDYNEAFRWYQLALKQGHAPAKSQIYKLAKKSVSPALKFLTKDAENGVPEAQLTLGQIHEKGQGVSQDYDEAFRWYQIALKQGHAPAKSQIYKLAKKSVSPALKFLTKDAENGVPEAQFTLGSMHEKGQGVSQDYNEAFRWYQLALKQGHAPAKSQIYKLAKKSVSPALKFLTKDAENGVPEAQFTLGSMHEKGHGVSQDYNEAFRWYQLALKQGHAPAKSQIYKLAKISVPPALKFLTEDAENGVPEAQLTLGQMHEKGQGASQDYNEAFRWYQIALKQGHAPAKSQIYKLAKISVSPALKFLTEDAENGVPEAQLTLGQMHEKGQGVSQDYNEALRWYQLALKQGHAPAKSQIYKLAKISVSPALKFLTKDAENGVPEAQFTLGSMHEKGQGVSQDYNEAFRWYQLALKQGHVPAKSQIYRIARNYISPALKFLTEDAENGVPEAQLTLGQMHEKGQGVSQDYNEAFRWYQIALKQGHAPAKSQIYKLAKISVPPALKFLTKDAENGVPEAQLTLGQMHEKGQGVSLDYNEAFKWFQLALKQGHVPAKSQIYRIARNYISPALKFLTEDAENGVPEAQFTLGQMHEKGQGVSLDFNEAFKWYQLALKREYPSIKPYIYNIAKMSVRGAIKILMTDAKKGIGMAQFRLGSMYEKGHGVPQDYNEAFKWHKLATEQGYTQSSQIYWLARQGVPIALKILIADAEKGNFDAQTSMGHMYEEGGMFPQDYNEAFKWYQLAAAQGYGPAKSQIYRLAKNNFSPAIKILIADAEKGNFDAQTSMAHMHEEGQGVSQDYDEAFKWYQIALKQGHAPAKSQIYKLAKKNVPVALKILTKDAKDGVAEAQFYFGSLHETGKGAPKDYNEAFKWYLLSAKQGYVQAQVNIGRIYEEGRGAIPQDYNKAFNWYRLAAEQEYTPAQFNLGTMYYKGRGVSQDLKKAKVWYQLSAVKGYGKAQVALGKIYEEGRVVPQDYREAFNLYRLAAEKEDSAGQLNLGKMYYKGQGTPQDYVLANMWFIIASLQENQEAIKYISLVENEISSQQKAKAQDFARKKIITLCAFKVCKWRGKL